MGAQTAVVRAGVSFQRIGVGRCRLLADGTMDNSPLAKFGSLELHTDGAGAYGLSLYDMATASRRQAAPAEGPLRQLLDDEAVAVATLSGLLWLAGHARDRAAAGGNAVVRVTLVPANAAESVELGHTRHHGFPDTRGRLAIGREYVVAEAVAPLEELATPGPTLAATAAVLIDEVAQAFGVPELGQFTRDGKLRRLYWGRQWNQQIVAWAQRSGIDVTEETLK
jgi:hypothetical protein